MAGTILNMSTLLSKELARRVKLDQALRYKALKDSSVWDESIDADNTKFMKELVKDIGWPKISDVGKRAAGNAWLLVQHADYDLNFQKLCLKLMKDLPKDEVDKSRIAYLEDRVLAAENKPQLYGTQFYHNKNGNLVPRKIKDKQGLDKRRMAMGLGPFSEYEEDIIKRYGKK